MTNEETLFFEWFCNKLKDYKKPIRKGVRKGDSIGVMFEKFMVCGLALLIRTGHTSVASDMVGKPMYLISKWRCESAVETLIEKFTDSFSEFFVSKVTARGITYTPMTLDHFIQPVRNKILMLLIQKAKEK